MVLNQDLIRNTKIILVYTGLAVLTLYVCLWIRSYGDAAHCRKALHRAVQCTSDYPEHVCDVLVNFERVEGELIDAYRDLCLYGCPDL